MKLLLFVLVLFAYQIVFAQVPSTNIYVVDVSWQKNKPSFSNPTQITDWKGYDNQPYFMADNKYLLYTSIQTKNQADIYKYNLETLYNTNLINTDKVSEYSPQSVFNTSMISVVRVETDDSTQHLWLYDSIGKPLKTFSSKSPIGYYNWIDTNTVMAYLLAKPFDKLILLNNNGNEIEINSNVGRCFLPYKVKKNKIQDYIYLSLSKTDSIHQFMQYNFATNTSNKLPFVTLKNVEDYCIANKNIWMGKNGILYEITKNGAIPVFDFGMLNIGNFYRIVYHPIDKYSGKLALVVYEK